MNKLLSEAEAYLTLGFVPSVRRASEYLDTLLIPGTPEAAETELDSSSLLRQILAENTYSKGHKEIVIPLTGGMDSRTILGAALDIFDLKAILCITVGVESFSDCMVAAETCRRVGVCHERVDPTALEWNIDKLVEMARERFAVTGSFVTLETLIAFGAISDRVGDQRPIISGYLGDAISGKHLPTEGGRLSGKPVEASFIANNRSISVGSHSPELCALFRSFAADNAYRLEGLPGGAAYDLLDLGFRQSHYIRPNSAAFPICVRPYEDPQWVHHWLSRPLADRIGQQAYLREIQRAFGHVFGTSKPQRLSRYRFIRSFVPRPVLRWIRTRLWGPQRSVAANRGDPRLNKSMAAVVRELLFAFDRRKILPFPTVPALDTTMRRFDNRKFAILQWASSAEIHIRAGNMTT